MRDAALALLPADRTSRNKLYQDLERGKGILDDEDHLNMYLHSFGKMHKAKLDAAFGCIPDISEIFSEEVEIYDWGCGQGTAAVEGSTKQKFLILGDIFFECRKSNKHTEAVP